MTMFEEIRNGLLSGIEAYRNGDEMKITIIGDKESSDGDDKPVIERTDSVASTS